MSNDLLTISSLQLPLPTLLTSPFSAIDDDKLLTNQVIFSIEVSDPAILLKRWMKR